MNSRFGDRSAAADKILTVSAVKFCTIILQTGEYTIAATTCTCNAVLNALDLT